MWVLLELPRFGGAKHAIDTTIGLDIAKSVFQVHGIDAEGNVLRSPMPSKTPAHLGPLDSRSGRGQFLLDQTDQFHTMDCISAVTSRGEFRQGCLHQTVGRSGHSGYGSITNLEPKGCCVDTSCVELGEVVGVNMPVP